MHWALASSLLEDQPSHGLNICIHNVRRPQAFSAIQGLIGSLCGSPILFGFPAAFYILACRLNKKKISTFDKVTCALFLCVLCPLFFLCGTIDSIMQIGDAVKDAGTPFSIC